MEANELVGQLEKRLRLRLHLHLRLMLSLRLLKFKGVKCRGEVER
jgi:hypothetical protein